MVATSCSSSRAYYLLDTCLTDANRFNAAGKARTDMEELLGSFGLTELAPAARLSERSGHAGDRLRAHLDAYKTLEDMFSSVDKSIVVLQLPMENHSLLCGKVLAKFRKDGGKIITIIHDLDSLRSFSNLRSIPSGTRRRLEEHEILSNSDAIIAHNDIMKGIVAGKYGCDPGVIVPLQLFDYLAPNIGLATARRDLPVVVAGKLTRQKAGYLYNLPDMVAFNLYGNGLEENGVGPNVTYKGVFPPDTLIDNLEGSFGLVWDGPSTEACEGLSGAYMKFNNPHRASLYAAAGLPLAVWSRSALASFVTNHNCGIAIDRIADIADIVSHMSDDEYQAMRTSAIELSSKVRAGGFTHAALQQCMKYVGER